MGMDHPLVKPGVWGSTGRQSLKHYLEQGMVVGSFSVVKFYLLIFCELFLYAIKIGLSFVEFTL